MLIRFVPSLLVVTVACRGALEPQLDRLTHGENPSVIEMGWLAPGDAVLVDMHLEGCFIYYDAQFRIDAFDNGVFLSGSVDLPLILHRPSRATIPARQLRAAEMTKIDNLLYFYRREAREGGCTTRVSLKMRVTRRDGSLQEERYFDGSCANIRLDGKQGTTQVLYREDAFFFTILASQAIRELVASW